jgi:hypothetical protein
MVIGKESVGKSQLLANIGGGFNVDLLSYLFGCILVISEAETWMSILPDRHRDILRWRPADGGGRRLGGFRRFPVRGPGLASGWA